MTKVGTSSSSKEDDSTHTSPADNVPASPGDIVHTSPGDILHTSPGGDMPPPSDPEKKREKKGDVFSQC